MKTKILTTAALVFAVGVSPLTAHEPPPAKCPMCGAMKASAAKPPKESAAQIEELDKLVAEMNGSLGAKKIEAMAAVVTRLVEQYKLLARPKPPPPAEPTKEEPHQH